VENLANQAVSPFLDEIGALTLSSVVPIWDTAVTENGAALFATLTLL
jgi:hypothetical protein